jgi:hypothetical protein
LSNWKKLVVSGSQAHLASVTASNGSVISGSLTMSGSINNVDHLNFYTTSSAATATGRLVWNDGDGTLDLGLKGGTLALQLGQDSFARVYNAETTTLNKGEIVYISGSQGNRISVKRADNDIEAGSANTLGMVSENILSGDEGFVFTSGIVNGLNTVGLTAGATLYLSSSGQYTQIPPVAPKHTVIIGFVERVNAVVGSIFVKINNGYELGELHNVLTNGANYGDLLMYSASIWTHSKQLSGSYGLTGSLQATSFTGSLQGTASNAVSSSYAVTSSFASSSPAVYDFGSFATPTDVGGGGNFGIVTDGDKGDITVTSSGSIWTIDNDAVTYAKIQNVTTSSVLLGRATTGAGNIEEIILGSGLTMSGTTLSAAGGSAPQVQVDTITSSQTWTPPTWAKYFKVLIYGGGGGGGAGGRYATTSGRSGGGPGGGGPTVIADFTNLQITGSVSITIGAGGSGSAGQTSDTSQGGNGTAGGDSTFGSLLKSLGGGGGTGGNSSSGTQGTHYTTTNIFANGSGGASSNGTTGAGQQRSWTTEGNQLTGGYRGGGGAGQAANVTTSTQGGTHDYWTGIYPSVAASSGGTNGGNGNNGITFTHGYATLGTPGGGGGYKTGQAGGNGGSGSYGCGGGGGAASDNGFTSGAGGPGGNGICIILSIG